MILSKRTRWRNFGKKLFHFVFVFRQIQPLQNIWFQKFLIPDAFKHVQSQNTFNSCKVHQILPITVDYACVLVKCINYQNVMCLKRKYFFQDLARLLQKMHFLQETQLLQNFCKKWESVAGLWQEFCKMSFLHEISKSCIDCKNFAKFLHKLFFLRTREHLY